MRATMSRRVVPPRSASWRLCLALGAAVSLAPSGEARADIEPPRGFEWLRRREISIVNRDAFPDHWLVTWPCSTEQFALGPYCILRDDEALFPDGMLYAIDKTKVKVGELPASERPASARGRAPLVIRSPALRDTEAFFKQDLRVIRPGFSLAPTFTSMLPKNTGVQSAKYFVEVTRIGAAGVEARYVRARYGCQNGTEVELPWGSDQGEPPIPSCPVTDDRGALITPNDAGVIEAGAHAGLDRTWAERSSLPLSPRHLMWLGVAITSLSLLGAGLLQRDRKRDAGG